MPPRKPSKPASAAPAAQTPAPAAPAPTPSPAAPAVTRSETKGSGTAKTAKAPAPAARDITHDMIAQRAFEIYAGRGYAPGDQDADWHEAERQLRAGL